MKHTLTVVVYDNNQFFAAGIRQTLVTYCQQKNILVRFEESIQEWGGSYLIFLAEHLEHKLSHYRNFLLRQQSPRIIKIRESSPLITYPYEAGILYRRQSASHLWQQISEALGKHPQSKRPIPVSDVTLLTPQENKVVYYLSVGSSTATIARYLNISIKTVSKHKRNVMKKLCFSRNIEFYHWLLRRGEGTINTKWRNTTLSFHARHDFIHLIR